MYKKLALCAIPVLIVTLIAGCSSSYVYQPSSPLEVTTKAELVPDIEVGQKITAQATVSRVMFFFTWGPGLFAEGVNYGHNYVGSAISEDCFGDIISEAKAAAAYKVCAMNNADVIIAPRYYVSYDNYFFYKTSTAKVFGYKGVLNGVKVKQHPPLVQSVKITDTVQVHNKPIELANPVELAQPVKLAQPIEIIQPAPKVTKPAPVK